MCSLGVVVLVQVLFLSKSQTTRRKASRLDTVFQIGNDLLVLALFLHSRPPLILLHCTLFFSFLAMSKVFLSFTSRGKYGILRKYDLHIKIQEREKIKSARTSKIISIQYPWSLDGWPLWWYHDSRRIAGAW